jgi:hypothetical protein
MIRSWSFSTKDISDELSARCKNDFLKICTKNMCVYCHPIDPIFHPDPKTFYWKIFENFQYFGNFVFFWNQMG